MMLTIRWCDNPENANELMSVNPTLSPSRQRWMRIGGRRPAQEDVGPTLIRAIAFTTESMFWLFSAATQIRPESTP